MNQIDYSRPPLIETRNVRAVKQSLNQAVNDRGFVAVIADVGSGKTRLVNHFTDLWQLKPHRYTVIKIKAFKSHHSRAANIMKLMLAEINPDMHIPGDIESRYEAMREALIESHKQNKHVILLIDEAQDLNIQTFKDLKKMHEIDGYRLDHLFTIVLFGKEHRVWDFIFKSPELGFRLRKVKLENLTSEEIVLIAKDRFNIKFQNEKTQQRFAACVKFKTPLGVKFLSDTLHLMPEFAELRKNESVLVTQDALNRLPALSDKFRIAQAGVKLSRIVEVAKQNNPNTRVNKSRVSERLNGKEMSDPMEQEIALAIEQSIGCNLMHKEKIKSEVS